MSFLQKIKELNQFDRSAFVAFSVAGQAVGAIRRDNVDFLRAFPDVFTVDEAGVRLSDKLAGPAGRTEAVAGVLDVLAGQGAFAYPLKGELFPVVEAWGQEPLLSIDRAVTPFFGLLVFGVHVNGFVRNSSGLEMWLGRRGPGVKVWSGCFDQMVAGGQPVGISLEDNVVKEGMEEARLPPDLMRQAIPCGQITYTMRMKEGVRRDTIFVYDLELPESVAPVADGAEVGEFVRLPVGDVARMVRDEDAFKPNCNLVVIDFLLRHGFLTPENEPEYQDIRDALRGSVSL
ncbi:MAG: DUF4743 domain-containing protein [Alphaproteobacteria bacterium]|nr:DUF4743 domain-containing protein [Alphaproteobacteria bacterium]